MIRLRTVKLVIFGEIPAAAERFKIFFLTLFVFRTKKGKTEYFANILNTLKAMKLLEGKVAVVTGAARGIGKAIALEFAKEGADVVLMRSDLMDVARAIELSRATIRNIKQDLFWALFYNGIGIPQEDAEKVFDRFYRVDKARSRESGGTGLGLSIAQEIVVRHGGRIELQSRLNKGTRITMWLPVEGPKDA